MAPYGRVVSRLEATRDGVTYWFDSAPDGTVTVSLAASGLSVPVRRARTDAELVEILAALKLDPADLREV